MKKSTRLIIVVFVLLALAALALWQFTDVFGQKGVSTPAPVQEATEAPAAEPTEAPAEEPTEAPVEEPAETPAEEPAEAPAEEPAEMPAEEPAASAEPAASVPELAEDAALATVNGEAITYAQVRSALYNLYNNGSLEDETDYDTALSYVIRNKILANKIKELGLDQFTPEEEEAFLADAKQEWEEAIQSYVEYFLSEDTEEARAQLYEEGEAYYQSYGYSVEMLADQLKEEASYDLLEEKMLDGTDVNPTEEEVRALFEEYANQDKEDYQDNIAYYEFNTYYYGYEPWYTPEGFRGITHILLTVDEELLNAYQSAQTAYEESVTEENPEGNAALLAALEEAKAAVLDSKKDKVADIYARLEKGESFESLIAEYGEDPGMEDAATLAAGYSVHPDSFLWDAAFTAGSFSEKMNQPGDTSDPVISSFGIHILHYLRDIPSGIVEMTDEIRDEIASYLTQQKANQIFNAALEGWEQEVEITYDQDAIAAARAIAALTEEE